MSDKIFLVDGSGYIFRAYYAVAPLTNSAGLPTNALFGFTRMLLKLLAQTNHAHLAVVFDAGKKTFRNDLYAEYKANRIECPEDLLKQMPYFREIAATLGLPVLEMPGYEADDLIGTMAKRFEAGEFETVIVSGDKDLMQLVDQRVSIWDTMKDLRYGPKEVKAKMGVPPHKVVDLLGLCGDSSDNIPGLSGVGPKTAVQLVERFEDIENIINSANSIRADSSIRNRAKIADQIELNPDLLRLSKKLVQIDTAVPFKLKLEGLEMDVLEANAGELFTALERRPVDPAQLHDLFAKLEFTSLLKEFELRNAAAKPAAQKFNYRLVWREDLPAFVEALKAHPLFAFDFETTSLDVLSAEVVGASFSWEDDGAYYIPLGHKEVPAGKAQLTPAEFFAALKPIFTDAKWKKSAQNAKYDIGVLARYGVELEGLAFDTMLASYLLNPDKGTHNLSELAHVYLSHTMLEFEELCEGLANFSEVPVDKAVQYACDDARVTWVLTHTLGELLDQGELRKVFDEIEVPLVPVLSKMERRGIKLDVEFLAEMSKSIEQRLDVLRGELFELAGSEFNLNSPKQLAEVLFTKLALPTKGIKKTKTGISTDSSVLEKLAPLHPLPARILDYRTLFKLKSTYVDALPSQVSAVSGRLHTRFNQAVTGTGRLSSSDPNLQNIPIQTEEGRRVRRAFIADAGKVLISADYSQIELRVLAHMSGDRNLIEAFKEGVDIHASTAREILNLGPLIEVSGEQRRIGKTINFGVIYGMGGFRLARELGIPVGTAGRYIDEYFERYSGVKRLFAEIEEQALSKGFVTTLFGRKRFVNAIDASQRDQGFVLRAALNAPIQGTAADIVKIAMLKLERSIRSSGLALNMLLQIHDELVFECDAAALEDSKSLIVHEMEGAVSLSVPLKVDLGAGANWQEVHEL